MKIIKTKYFSEVGNHKKIEDDVNKFLETIGERFIDIKIVECCDNNNGYYYYRTAVVVYEEKNDGN